MLLIVFFDFPCVLCWLVDLISLFLIVVVVFFVECVCVWECGGKKDSKFGGGSGFHGFFLVVLML